MSSEQTQFGDVVVVERRTDAGVERRTDVRMMASIPGKFSLSDRRDKNGDRRIFACRAVNITPHWIALASPISGKLGDRVIAHFDHIGKVEGPITHVLERGFVMGISTSAEQRESLAAKITWLEKSKNHDTHDRRTTARMTPKDLYSSMILPDGSRETCLVLDISTSGAGISANTVPEIGTIVTIGAVQGRVVRHFEGGFGVQFLKS
jgi:hypothetical protein